MAGRRRQPRPPVDLNLVEGDQQDGLHWPTLRACWAGRSEAEITAAHRRARQLVEGGYGSIRW